jgi:hypothetical protein
MERLNVKSAFALSIGSTLSIDSVIASQLVTLSAHIQRIGEPTASYLDAVACRLAHRRQIFILRLGTVANDGLPAGLFHLPTSNAGWAQLTARPINRRK